MVRLLARRRAMGEGDGESVEAINMWTGAVLTHNRIGSAASARPTPRVSPGAITHTAKGEAHIKTGL
jgi:hypothetical protein